MVAILNPFICKDCNELDMALICTVEEMLQGKEPDYKPICDKCGSTNLMKWHAHKRPCPKCKTGKMNVDRHGAMALID